MCSRLAASSSCCSDSFHIDWHWESRKAQADSRNVKERTIPVWLQTMSLPLFFHRWKLECAGPRTLPSIYLPEQEMFLVGSVQNMCAKMCVSWMCVSCRGISWMPVSLQSNKIPSCHEILLLETSLDDILVVIGLFVYKKKWCMMPCSEHCTHNTVNHPVWDPPFSCGCLSTGAGPGLLLWPGNNSHVCASPAGIPSVWFQTLTTVQET